jgi:hypothetical protein
MTSRDNDYKAIVNAAADRVQIVTKVAVPIDARQVLLDRLSEHRAEVQQAIRRDGLTTDELISAAESQLREALLAMRSRLSRNPQHGIPGLILKGGPFSSRPRFRLTAADVRAGIKKKCHWIPWC